MMTLNEALSDVAIKFLKVEAATLALEFAARLQDSTLFLRYDLSIPFPCSVDPGQQTTFFNLVFLAIINVLIVD
jgi:hypothetical protein